MLEFIRSIPLTGTVAEAITWLILITFTTLLFFAQPKGKRRRIGFVCAVLGLIMAISLLAVIILFFGVPLDEIHYRLIVAGICVVTSLLLTGSAVIRHWRKLWTAVPLSLVTAACMLVGNQTYGLFPDVESLYPEVTYNEIAEKDLPAVTAVDKTVPWNKWEAPRNMPQTGARVSMHVPTPKSGFPARPADVYLPPAWFSNPRPELPVLVLMHGIPGAPEQWIDQAGALKPVVDYQKRHSGLAPIIVSVDSTGGWVDNPVCTDGPKAKLRTYLTDDLPQWIIGRLGANPDQGTWTLGGLSYGGTCSLQIVANSPGSYGTFLDYSGELTPNDGQSHQSTVQNFFNGSEDEFKRHNPADILSAAASNNSQEFAHVAGRFVAGMSDHSSQNDLQKLHDLAQKAGIDSTFRTIPGGHDFRVWRTALSQDFAWVAQRGGLPS